MKTTNDVAQSHGIVLTNENAKKFATRLKKTLKENSIDFKTSKCYDILAKTFGSSNWHELSQHLSNDNTSEKMLEKTQHDDKLNSIFDLPWVEFKYIMSKIATHLDFDFYTKEFLDILLDILHENQPRSEIYWEKLNEFLQNTERNFRNEIECVPVHDYTTVLNPTLSKEQFEKFHKRIIKSGSSEGYFRIRFSPEKIEGFFYMLEFLKNENFILRDMHTNFNVSEVLQYTENTYSSNYPFISTLIRLADINNDYIQYNPNYYKKLTFHDLIINLYSRTNLLKYVGRVYELSQESKDFSKEIFENNKFISYLFSHLKTYINNYVGVTFKEKKDIYNGQPGIETFNIINYELNYVPHNLILKHEIENLDWSKFKNTFTYEASKEALDSTMHFNLLFKINEGVFIKNQTCVLDLDVLRGKFTPNNKNVFINCFTK